MTSFKIRILLLLLFIPGITCLALERQTLREVVMEEFPQRSSKVVEKRIDNIDYFFILVSRPYHQNQDILAFKRRLEMLSKAMLVKHFKKQFNVNSLQIKEWTTYANWEKHDRYYTFSYIKKENVSFENSSTETSQIDEK